MNWKGRVTVVSLGPSAVRVLINDLPMEARRMGAVVELFSGDVEIGAYLVREISDDGALLVAIPPAWEYEKVIWGR